MKNSVSPRVRRAAEASSGFRSRNQAEDMAFFPLPSRDDILFRTAAPKPHWERKRLQKIEQEYDRAGSYGLWEENVTGSGSASKMQLFQSMSAFDDGGKSVNRKPLSSRKANSEVQMEHPPHPPAAVDVDWGGFGHRPKGRLRLSNHRAQKDSIALLFSGNGNVEENTFERKFGSKKHVSYSRDPRFAPANNGKDRALDNTKDYGTKFQTPHNLLGPGGMEKNGSSSWKTSYQTAISGEPGEVDKFGNPLQRGIRRTNELSDMRSARVRGRKKIEPIWATKTNRNEGFGRYGGDMENIVSAKSGFGIPRAVRGSGIGSSGTGGGASLLHNSLVSSIVAKTAEERNRGAKRVDTFALRREDPGLSLQNFKDTLPGYTGHTRR